MFPFDQTTFDPLQDLMNIVPEASLPKPDDKSVPVGFHHNQGFVGAENLITERDTNKEYEDEARKFMHREIERQRRQEMANLCGSLRTLIPLHYIKGKRSTSDIVQEALNYIKGMENNICHLKAKRDKLLTIKSSNSSHNFCSQGSYSCEGNDIGDHRRHLLSYVTVNPCLNGAEILFNEHEQGFPLSRILTEVIGGGFGNVVSCVSTRVHGRLLHRIQIEGRNYTFEDASMLQHTLNLLINSNTILTN